MLRQLSLLGVCVAVLAGSAALATGRQTYAIDPAASRVIVHVDKSGLFAFAGHAHEVSAPVANGTVIFDPEDPASSTIQIEFDAAALQVTGRGEPAKDVPAVQRTMQSGRVLDVSAFPRIAFASRAFRLLDRTGGGLRLRVDGDLMLHGVTRPAGADVTAALTPDGFRVTGALVVKQTDFGIEPVTAGGGTVRVKDEVRVEFTLVVRAAGSHARS